MTPDVNGDCDQNKTLHAEGKAACDIKRGCEQMDRKKLYILYDAEGESLYDSHVRVVFLSSPWGIHIKYSVHSLRIWCPTLVV